jgi:diguanylate cyclase (GGDEF)-like protein
MTESNNNTPLAEETNADRLRGILANDAFSLDLVSALAGDRPITETDTVHFESHRKSRGIRFFCDVLYSITHQYFPPEVAEELWGEVLLHKIKLSTILGRNVRIAVAALDYLSNITSNMGSAILVDEANIGEIVELSLRDGLTGLFNHTYFYQQIDFEVKRYARYGALVSLMLIDIDDFKSVNDTFGHREGDRILAAMGSTLIRMARDSDICCRYGGEELSVILPLTDIDEAGAIAQRIQANLAEKLPNGLIVTVSIGVATCGEKTRTFRDLVEKADAALYQVKRSGKNRVKLA